MRNVRVTLVMAFSRRNKSPYRFYLLNHTDKDKICIKIQDHHAPSPLMQTKIREEFFSSGATNRNPTFNPDISHFKTTVRTLTTIL